MDNITHTLFGATLGRAAFHRAGRGTTAAIVLGSNAPDADIVMAAGGALDYLTWHRGPTHGPLGIVGLAVITAAVVWTWQRFFDTTRSHEHASYTTLTLAAGVGLTAHVLMDFPTSYGTRLLSPFDWSWYAADLMPIIDIYLLAVLAGCLALGGRRWHWRRTTALLAIVYALGNYAVRASAHHWAISAAPRALAEILPARCPDSIAPSLLSRWPVDTAATHRARGAERCLVEVAAVPTFFSPFRWQIVARATDAYETVDLNLLRDLDRPIDTPSAPDDRLDAPWRRSTRYPDQWTPAALQAARTELGRVFLGFSRFPATSSTLNEDDSASVRWVDLRFVNTLGRRPASTRGMFSAHITLAPDGHVLSMDLGE